MTRWSASIASLARRSAPHSPSIRVTLLALALAGCASSPPQGAVDEAATAVRANPELTAIFGEGYTARYDEDDSISSASLGTRVQFGCEGPKGSGTACVQFGHREERWTADNVSVTLHQHTRLKKVDGAWKAEPAR